MAGGKLLRLNRTIVINRPGARRRLWLGLLAFVLVMALLPGRFVPDWAHGKELHFLAYAVLAAVALAVIRRRRIAWLAVATTLVLSIGLEYVQLFIPGRTFELSDMVASVSGLAAGVLVGLILRRLRR